MNWGMIKVLITLSWAVYLNFVLQSATNSESDKKYSVGFGLLQYIINIKGKPKPVSFEFSFSREQLLNEIKSLSTLFLSHSEKRTRFMWVYI